MPRCRHAPGSQTERTRVSNERNTTACAANGGWRGPSNALSEACYSIVPPTQSDGIGHAPVPSFAVSPAEHCIGLIVLRLPLVPAANDADSHALGCLVASEDSVDLSYPPTWFSTSAHHTPDLGLPPWSYNERGDTHMASPDGRQAKKY